MPRLLPTALAALALLAAGPSLAQLPTQLPGGLGGALGGGSSGGGGALAGGGLPSVGHAGAADTAGVLSFCVKNNYLGGGSGASGAASALLGRVPGGQHNSAYQQGQSGLLDTGNGQTFNLGGGGESGGGGLKAQATHKICDLVLQHAKSLL